MAYDPNCEETKAAFETLLAEKTSGLTTKNKELLNEVKELRRNGGNDPKVVERLENQVEQLQGELTTTQSELRSAQKGLEKATKTAETEASISRNLLVENGLTAALVSVKVGEAYLDGAKALHQGKVEVVDENGTRVAKLNGKPLAEAIKEWAESDQGKHYVSPPHNGGGGGGGGDRDVNAKTISRAAFDAMSPAQQMEHATNGGVVQG